jgi:hypothetical protein
MTTRASIAKEIELRLGGQMIDVELDPEHYDLAINKALEKYRQRSENAVEEDFHYFDIVEDVNVYQFPNDIIEVRDLYGRPSGTTSTGVDFDPFEANYINAYMQGGAASGVSGSLATYDLIAQFHETLGRLMGAEYSYTWRRHSHQLLIHRRPRYPRPIYAHVYRYRNEDSLFNDYMAAPWIKEYALAQGKFMLGEARGKFSQIAGPQGGTTLNGDALKSEATETIAQLEEDLKLYKDGGAPLGIIIG